MSKAVTFSAYGGPEVLQLTDVEEPQTGTGQVRVRVQTAGVNPMDWKLRRGLMTQVRAVTFPAVPGGEFAGVVDQVGPGVSGVSPGDEVLGSAAGAYAERVVTDQFVPRPAGLAWEVAGGLSVVARTAHGGLDELGIGAGETLLIHGAAGGVGSVAVQLARRRGATVIGTAGEANHDYLRSLGATPVAYGEGLVERVHAVAPRGVDAVFDTAGKGALPASLELAGSADRVVTIADPAAGEHGVRFLRGAWDPSALSKVADLVAAGDVQLPIWRTYPLAEAAAAQVESEKGHLRGKIVLLVS